MTTDKRRLKGLYWDRALYLVDGCTQVDEGCRNCWAYDLAGRFGRVNPQLLNKRDERWSGKVEFKKEKLLLLKMEREHVTWCVWNDLFHEDIKTDDIISALLTLVGYRDHTFIVLTKRIKRLWQVLNLLEMKWPDTAGHMWFGTSISSTEEKTSIARLSELVVRGIRFPRIILSIEPMLGKVDLASLGDIASAIDLIVCGCESGPKRRKAKNEWLYDLLLQSVELKIPLFLKQWDWSGKKILKPESFPSEYKEFTELPF